MVDVQDLAKYPFLEEAQDYVRREAGTLDSLLKSERGRALCTAAADRAVAALSRTNPQECGPYGRDAPEDLFSYVIARMLVSCLADRMLIERLSQFEAHRAYLSFIEEDEGRKEEIARALGIEIKEYSMPVLTYVPLVVGLHEDRWSLVNRIVTGGRVLLFGKEAEELVRERMREIVRERLPLSVPEDLCRQFAPYTEIISAAAQQQALEEFGDVDESSFPPCIAALITAVTAGTNLPHVGRFALTAFLHNIGLSTPQIVEVFQRAPDFDVSMTMYQVEHISGRSGTEYTAPACATMRTHGLCVRRDALCEKVNHPLTYYKRKKKNA